MEAVVLHCLMPPFYLFLDSMLIQILVVWDKILPLKLPPSLGWWSIMSARIELWIIASNNPSCIWISYLVWHQFNSLKFPEFILHHWSNKKPCIVLLQKSLLLVYQCRVFLPHMSAVVVQSIICNWWFKHLKWIHNEIFPYNFTGLRIFCLVFKMPIYEQ